MIEVRSLTKRFGSTLAVDDLSFGVQPGRVTGFLGPNGAGKTTTLRSLLGLVHPTSGGAWINGRTYGNLAEPIREVGAVLEASGFHKGRSGRDHLRTIATAAGIPRSRADEVLALVGLTGAANRRAGGYSMGMRQRLAIATALLGDPSVLVLDEPANGLDPQGIRWLRDFVRHLAGEGRTVLVSSHVLAEVAQTVDEVVVIHQGRFRAHLSVAELTRRQAEAIRLRSPEPGRLEDVLVECGVRVERDGADTLIAHGADPQVVGGVIAQHGIVIFEMSPQGASLEEVFLDLTEAEAGAPVPDQPEAS